MQILVLAMHRSGSSVLARILNMMGAYISSEEEIMLPKPDNKKGFWERNDVCKLNDRILTLGGGSWDNPYSFSLESIHPEQRDELSHEAHDIITKLDLNRPWILKDPRMCLTFPIWKEFLELPICIFLHRDPVEIAKSLEARNGIPYPVGIALWEYYAVQALKETVDIPRININQKDLFTTPTQIVEELFASLKEFGVSQLRRPNDKELSAFIDPSLRHHNEELNSLHDNLTGSQQHLANLFTGQSSTDDLQTLTVSRTSAITFELFLQNRQQASTITALEAQFDKSSSTIQQLEADNRHLRTKLENTVSDFEKLRAQSKVHEEVRTRNEQSITELTETLSNIKQDLADARETIKVERSAFRQIESSFQEESQQLATAIDRNRQQILELTSTLERELENKRNMLDEHRKEHSNLKKENKSSREKLSTVEKEKSEVSHKLTELENENYIAAQLNANLSRSIQEARGLYEATKESWRWKIGDRTVRTVEILLGRNKPELAFDRFESTLSIKHQKEKLTINKPRNQPSSSHHERETEKEVEKQICVIQMTPATPRNPFFSMIGNELTRSGLDYRFITDRDEVLGLTKKLSKQVIVHFHQLEPFYVPGTSTESAIRKRANRFLDFCRSLVSEGAKIVWTKHNPAPHDRSFLDVGLEVENSMADLAHKVVLMANGAVPTLNRIERSKIEVIPHPSYRSYYGSPTNQKEAREKLGLPTDCFLFGCIGEIKPYKGLEFIIDAFSKFSDKNRGNASKLIIAGNPSDSSYVSSINEKSQAEILIYPTDIPSADLQLWVSAMDCTVYAFKDIWVSGSVILSLSYCRPVIVPNLGFLDEYVEHHNTGIFYEPSDIDSLAAAMIEIQSTPYWDHYVYMCNVFSRKHELNQLASSYSSMYFSLHS